MTLKISKYYDVISPSQCGVILFTRGDKLTYDTQGNGMTGNWKVDPQRIDKVDKVIIYLREPGSTHNRIFIANYASVLPSSEAGRSIIRFNNLKEVGITTSNWLKFAEGGQIPIRYIG